MVRHHNILFDTFPPKNMDTNLKNQIWQKTGDKLQLSSISIFAFLKFSY